MVGWSSAKVGDVLQPNSDTFVRIGAIDWDGTIWDTHGSPWRSLSGQVLLLRPDDLASRELLMVMMHSHNRHKPVISVVDLNGNELNAG